MKLIQKTMHIVNLPVLVVYIYMFVSTGMAYVTSGYL